MKKLRIDAWPVESRVFILLGFLVLVPTLFGEGFWALRNLQNLSSSLAIQGIMAVGMTIVMIGRGFDLSIGSVMALSGVLVMTLQPWGLVVSCVAALAAAGAIGLINGLLVCRAGVNPFIATLGTMIAVRGMVMSVTDAQPIAGQDMDFILFGIGKGLGLPWVAWFFLAVLLLGHLMMAYMKTGRALYALGGNEAAARASGVHIEAAKVKSYILCALCAGIAGILLAARLNTGSPIIGENAALQVITAVLLGGVSLSGGIGSMPGTLAGLLSIGVLSNSLNLFDVPAYYQRIAQGCLLLSAVVLDRWRYRR
jgi:ribose transport system permease protein